MSPRRSKSAAPSASLARQASEVERLLTMIREHLRKPVSAAYAKGGLTGPQRSVMQVLVRSPQPLSIQQVRSELGLAQSTVSGIVDRLVQLGTITRRPDPADGRGVLLEPSAEVRRFLRTQLPALTATPIAAALRRTTPARRAQILSALTSLNELLQRTDA
jgi:DNA-binding MarR family transcriptional regulator